MIEHVWGLHLRLESPHKHEHGFRYYIYIYIYTYIRTCAARQITWYPRKAGPATEKGIPGNSFYAIEPLTHVWSPTIEKCAKIIERIYRFNIWIDHTRRKSSNARPQTSDHILYVHPMQIDQIDLAPGQTTSNRSRPTHRTRPDQTDRPDRQTDRQIRQLANTFSGANDFRGYFYGGTDIERTQWASLQIVGELVSISLPIRLTS